MRGPAFLHQGGGFRSDVLHIFHSFRCSFAAAIAPTLARVSSYTSELDVARGSLTSYAGGRATMASLKLEEGPGHWLELTRAYRTDLKGFAIGVGLVGALIVAFMLLIRL